ncbi:DUF624 domain-containing protein [Brachybacterium sp. DNPG3]
MSSPAESDPIDRVFRLFELVVRVVLLSFLGILLSLPIVTAPAALTATAATIRLHLDERHRGFLEPYFEVFRDSFRRVTWRGLVLLAAISLFVLTGASYVLGTDPGAFRTAGASVQLLAATIALAILIRLVDGTAQHWLRGATDASPGLRGAARTVLHQPLGSGIATLAVIAVPVLMAWSGLWQIVLLVPGLQCFLAVLALRRIPR